MPTEAVSGAAAQRVFLIGTGKEAAIKSLKDVLSKNSDFTPTEAAKNILTKSIDAYEKKPDRITVDTSNLSALTDDEKRIAAARIRDELFIKIGNQCQKNPEQFADLYQAGLKDQAKKVNDDAFTRYLSAESSPQLNHAKQLSLIASETAELDKTRTDADTTLKRANQAIALLEKNKRALEEQQKLQASSKSQAKNFDSAINSISISIGDLRAKIDELTTAKNNAPKNPYTDRYQSGQQELQSACNALQKTISQSIDRKNLRAAFYVLKKTSPDDKPTGLPTQFIDLMKTAANNEPTALKRLESIESKITAINENIQRLDNITNLMASKESSELYHDEYRKLLEAIEAQSKDLRKDLENEDIQKAARAISDKGNRNDALNALRKLSNQTAALMHDSHRAIYVQNGSLVEDERAPEKDLTSLNVDMDDSHSASARDEISRSCVITYYERVPKENGTGYEFKKRTITDLTLSQTRNLAELWNGKAGWDYCKEKGIEWYPVDISKNFFGNGFQLRFENKELKNEFITGFRETILGNQKTSIAEKAASANGDVTPPAPSAIPGLTQ